jgi:hypothetical protein
MQGNVEQKERNSTSGLGMYLNSYCPICKEPRGKEGKHNKCSKIMQKRRLEEDLKNDYT